MKTICPYCRKSYPDMDITVIERRIWGTDRPTYIVGYICESCLRSRSRKVSDQPLAEILYDPAVDGIEKQPTIKASSPAIEGRQYILF